MGIDWDGGQRLTVLSEFGPATTYRIPNLSRLGLPVLALLLDLDGTSLDSEAMWVDVLGDVLRTATGGAQELTEDSREALQGASTDVHLIRLRSLFALDQTLEELRALYAQAVEVAFYRGPLEALAHRIPLKAGFADLRAAAISQRVPLLLVTNGNERKARRELEVLAWHLAEDSLERVSAGIWCAGRDDGWLNHFGGSAGKPHPWPYFEAAVLGAGVPVDALDRVVAVDDSASGVVSARLAGAWTVGVAGGNIAGVGAHGLCHDVVASLHDVVTLLGR